MATPRDMGSDDDVTYLDIEFNNYLDRLLIFFNSLNTFYFID
jgi:hypothetical protein